MLELRPGEVGRGIAAYLGNIRVVSMIVIGIILFGVFSLSTLQRRINPEVEIPIVNVVTALPGADPSDVEQLVTIPIEEELEEAEGLDTLSSVSQDSVSIVTAQFVSTVSRDEASDEIQRLVDGVSDLPATAEEPEVTGLDFEDIPIWEFVLVAQDGARASLDRVAEELRDELDGVRAVDRVQLFGLEEQEVAVSVPLTTISQNQLSINDIRQAVSGVAQGIPSGTVYQDGIGLPLGVRKELQTVQDLREARITVAGESAALQDIAQIERQSAPNQQRVYTASPEFEPQAAIRFVVYKTKNADSTTAQQDAAAVVDSYLVEHPAAVALYEIESRAVAISDQFAELFSNFATSIILVFVVLFLFIGVRQALIASLTIPLAFLISFIVMRATGQSLNFLSMFSLLIALGLLVDDAIVIISSITEYYRTKRFTPTEAGLLVWRDFSVPIWTTTLTTVWAFAPLLLSTGIIGEFIRPIPIIVSATLIASTSVAVAITLPLMMQLLAFDPPKRVRRLVQIIGAIIGLGVVLQLVADGPLRPLVQVLLLLSIFGMYWVRQRWMHGVVQRTEVVRQQVRYYLKDRSLSTGLISLKYLRDRYEAFVYQMIVDVRRRRLVVAGVILAAIASYFLVPLGLVRSEFFPPSEADVAYLNVELPSGSELRQTEAILTELGRAVRKLEAIELVVIQPGIAPVSAEQLPGSGGDNTGVLTLRLTPEKERERSVFAVADEAQAVALAAYPGLEIASFVESGGPPAGSDVTIKILGEDIAGLNLLAEKITTELEQYPVENIARSLTTGGSKLSFVPDEAVLAEVGLSQSQLGAWLRTYVTGSPLTDIRLSGESDSIAVTLYFDSPQVVQADALSALYVPTAIGPQTISDLGQIVLEPTTSVIARENGQRTLVVTAGTLPGASAAEVNADIIAYAASLPEAQGYVFETGGANEENQESVASILQAMLLAFVLIGFTMVVQFNSFRQAVIVSGVIPLAISGVFIIFALTRTPLSFPSLIGILALFGIVINNSIVIVDKINRNQVAGLPLRSAIADGASSRLEPIFFSSLTTIMGLLPITLTDPLWRGLGGAIISGLLFSGAVMLLFIPAVYAQVYLPLRTPAAPR